MGIEIVETEVISIAVNLNETDFVLELPQDLGQPA